MIDVRALPLEDLLRSRKRLLRELREQTSGGVPVRVAVLGGTTTNEVVDLLELLLVADGFVPSFYQSGYGRFYEDATFHVADVATFEPDLVYLHTHVTNISRFPSPDYDEAELEKRLSEELGRFQRIWQSIHTNVHCQIVQNNFEHPPFPLMGNLDSTAPGGHTRFVYELNRAFARHASAQRHLLIHDIHALAARVGLDRWFDWERWFSYKILTTPEASLALASSLASQVGALRGRARKCLILDLDNTLWGGVIGDDGVERLHIGNETALGEAYTAFQRYCLSLRDRGVLLAVCSKNDEAIARSGLAHPDSVLKAEHFSAFKANWDPKPDNIKQIASELNLGLDSFVFVDDNPAERALVRAQLPMVAVPEVGADVAQFRGAIQAGRYFEMAAVSKEDLGRAAAYQANRKRTAALSQFKEYGDYLDSLQMTGEIGPFRPVYLERIAQLINKTNQFNLTTRRYMLAEIEQIATDPRHITLYGRLVDVFGDNGVISVVIGRLEGQAVRVDLWIMSCRVLKRDMELAMLDALAQAAQAAGALELRGTYIPTSKNAMVADHYRSLGFEPDGSSWRLDLNGYSLRNRHIKVEGQWTEQALSAI